MTNFSEEAERYDHAPDAPGVVPWARMSPAARASWGLLCLTNRMPLDATQARWNPRSGVVLACRDSDSPVREDPEHAAVQRKIVVAGYVRPIDEVMARARMVFGNRAAEVAALVDDDNAGRARPVRDEPGRATLFGPPREIPNEEDDDG